MNIYISDVGIFKSDTTSYPVTNTASVEKVKPISGTNQSTDSVARQAQKAYVAENTPAYTISLSSMGKAAVQSMKLAAENMQKNVNAADDGLFKNNFVSVSKERSTSDESNNFGTQNPTSAISAVSDVFATAASAGTPELASSTESTEAAEETEITSASSVSGNLGRYTDYQLQQLLDDGSITRAQYNTEMSLRTSPDGTSAEPVETAQERIQDPVMSAAIAAYNFQMSYQINALITQ